MALRFLSRLQCWLLLAAATPLAAQEVGPPVVDSLAVEGHQRLTTAQILGTAGLVLGQSVSYRDVQRAVTALFQTGQFDDVRVEQREANNLLVLAFVVRERPVLQKWSIKGVERLSERSVKERVYLVEGRPIDRNVLERSRAGIDSLYVQRGFYRAKVRALEVAQAQGGVRVVFDIDEGSRVAISQVVVEGNERYSDKDVVKQMGTRPEGFFWFQRGEYDEGKLETDIRERLPRWYASRGLIDFQVTRDSLVADSTGGKAILILGVEEGRQYRVGTFNIVGNRRFSSDELATFYPFGGPAALRASSALADQPYDRAEWQDATEKIQTLYANNGYIYAQVQPEETRRTAPDGTPIIDLQWRIVERSPATINRVIIVGNDVTHERIIREAIVLLPGSLFSRERLIQSYQNISNLGFFQQPMPAPDVRQTDNQVDVDIIFRVEERRTGNINFGASLGQGTGIGGFLGLEEPNLFGRGKRGRLQWQFGRNINDFTLSYTDPAIRESRISGTVTLFNSRQRFTIEDLGRRRQEGGSLQLGFPFFGSRYTRVFASYGFQRIRFTEGSQDIRARFRCSQCSRSTLGASLLRDTRIGLPFATAGAQTTVSLEANGGLLGGTGDYRKMDFEGRWYAPLGTLGGSVEDFGGGIRFVLGLTAKTGFIFGDAGPFFTELYSLGGTQFGIPLRGYEEFSVTPNGFDPGAGGNAANPDAFGKAYAAFTVELGARISQSLYFSSFFDAGNVYRDARQYDPTRLFRGAGFGVAVISPLGPLGLDLGYGFDKLDAFGKPAPGWKLHFKLGQFF